MTMNQPKKETSPPREPETLPAGPPPPPPDETASPPPEHISYEELKETRLPEGPPHKDTLTERPEELGRRYLEGATQTDGREETELPRTGEGLPTDDLPPGEEPPDSAFDPLAE